MSTLSPVGYWSRLSERSQMVALFVLVTGLLAVVAIASAARPLAGAWRTSSPPRPHGKAHCTQVDDVNPVTGFQIPQYHCTYATITITTRATHPPCPLLHGYCGGYEEGSAAGPLHGPTSGVVYGEGPRRAPGSTRGLSLFLVAGSLVGLLLLTVGAVRLMRSRRSATAAGLLPKEAYPAAAAEEEDSAATEEAALALAADKALAELRIEGDARRAIIACYAQMERSLARAGMARRPSEAPLEYLARILASVAPVAALTLTDLYERAMFSGKPMTHRDKARAIAALETLRQAAA